MKIITTKNDYLWNYLGAFFRLGGSFLLLPFLLFYLDDQLLGLWYVYLAIASFVTLFQSGFVPSFSRNVAYCWSGVKRLQKIGLNQEQAGSQDIDYGLLSDIVEASRLLYRAIAIISIIAISIGGTIYVVFISEEIEQINYLPAWGIFCIGIFLNMYFSYYESLLRGVGDFPDINKSTIVSSLVKIMTSAIMLIFGCGLISCSIGYLVQGIIFRMMCRRYFFNYNGLGEKLLNAKHEERQSRVREVLSAVSYNAAKDTVVSIANFCVTTANTIICSMILTLSTTGTYSVILQLVNAVASLANIMLTTNQPSLQSAFARGDVASERLLMAKTSTGFIIIYLVCIAFVALVVMPIVMFIRPAFECDWLLFAMMSIYLFLWKQHSMGATFLANTNELPYVPAFVLSALFGVVVTILFAKYTTFGLYSLVLGQAIIQLLYNNWKWPHEAAARINVSYCKLVAEGFQYYYQSLRNVIAKTIAKKG